MSYSDEKVLLAAKVAKAWLNKEALPWAALDRLKQAMMMRRHRRFARIGADTTIFTEGQIENPSGEAERIRIGERCGIRGHLFVFPHGGSITIGDAVYIGAETRIWSSAQLAIGDSVLISHQVNIMDTDGHSMDPTLREIHWEAIRTIGHPRSAQDIKAAPINIGDRAWICAGATIMKGVNVGEGAVVASRSVVTKDVPGYKLVAGFPAEVVRDLSHLRYPAP